jgi:F-type H+-transporting ATPase subunit alpha
VNWRLSRRWNELDPATQRQIDRGQRLVEVLKQGQYVPMDVAEQVAIIYAGTEGLLDKVPVTDVKNFEEKFIEHLGASHRDVLDGIRNTGELKDPQALKKIVEDYVEQYLGSK